MMRRDKSPLTFAPEAEPTARFVGKMMLALLACFGTGYIVALLLSGRAP